MHLLFFISPAMIVVIKSISGPFVMNTNEQIQEAISDYRKGKNGFEKAPGWKSAGRD